MQTSINDKITFIMLIGNSLHRYGASADRVEKALTLIALKLNIDSQYFAFPTGIFASFKEEGHEHTRMDRLEPGKINLSKLLWVDEVVDRCSGMRSKLMKAHKKFEK